MTLAGLAKPAGDGFSPRFVVVSYLPSLAAAVFLLLLVWAGAPGPLTWSRAWKTAAGLGAGEAIGLAVGLTLLAVAFMPLQLSVVRLLEGYWPRFLTPLDRLLRVVQRWRRGRLARRAELPDDAEPTPAQVLAAGLAGTQLERRYPVEENVRATTLGNVLAAAEQRAGANYGWDAVVAWPRLYPVLTEQVRAVVDARRDSLDSTARLALTGVLTAVASACLLARSGWWCLLALVPLGLGWLAYVGAVRAAIAYGEAVVVAFDLGRFDLLTALHLHLPATRAAEHRLAEALCLQWRQGVQLPDDYDHVGTSAE
ncbi:hypothetical protein ADK67_29055 [Saccharothrix sp. NRRL B-16348]|uniref:hypothetical protein n=1 Tax=Saccharothrix sp. NRRL B-16348 TaxID=1415542 RepID=UPI0006AF2486|nr:hypothetical protein [Saccharothrix sp. NRRL B-16348]KOX20625.1 hypothetical protein ADK67_29055 [Saccharothrix sp. NRRL B-16348]